LSNNSLVPCPYTDFFGELYLLFLHPTYYASPLVSSKLIILAGITALANAIPNMRALLSLDISSNSLGVEGTKLLAKALKSNQTMTSLNISSNGMTFDGNKSGDVSGVAALADAIPGMGALTKLDISSNDIGAEQEGGLQRICVARGIELAT
jgi:Ran GTPase-activating protein (RanGAP) involved in mRNA processing and transport